MKELGALPADQQELNGKNKPHILKALVHAADIGNPTRPFDIAKIWSEKIVREFFDQGDKERALGLEITMMCDRTTGNFAKGQIGFIGFMVAPYFDTLSKLVPKLKGNVDQAKSNEERYKTMIDEYDQIMKDGNK